MNKAVVVAGPDREYNSLICSELAADGYVAFQVGTIQQLRNMVDQGIHGYHPCLCIMSADLDQTVEETIRAAREFRERGLAVFWISVRPAPEGAIRIDPEDRSHRRLKREVRKTVVF